MPAISCSIDWASSSLLSSKITGYWVSNIAAVPPLVYYNRFRYELNYLRASGFGMFAFSPLPPIPMSPISSISLAISSALSFLWALDYISPKWNSESGPLSILIPSMPEIALMASEPEATLMSVVFIIISR